MNVYRCSPGALDGPPHGGHDHAEQAPGDQRGRGKGEQPAHQAVNDHPEQVRQVRLIGQQPPVAPPQARLVAFAPGRRPVRVGDGHAAPLAGPAPDRAGQPPAGEQGAGDQQQSDPDPGQGHHHGQGHSIPASARISPVRATPRPDAISPPLTHDLAGSQRTVLARLPGALIIWTLLNLAQAMPFPFHRRVCRRSSPRTVTVRPEPGCIPAPARGSPPSRISPSAAPRRVPRPDPGFRPAEMAAFIIIRTFQS